MLPVERVAVEVELASLLHHHIARDRHQGSVVEVVPVLLGFPGEELDADDLVEVEVGRPEALQEGVRVDGAGAVANCEKDSGFEAGLSSF